MKNANPSSENGIPITGPANRMKVGQSRPSSNDSTVPDTAPMANRIAVPLAQRLARSRHSRSPVFRYRRSATTISTGMPMPTTAKMMWKPSETAICERAAKRSDTRDPG